MLWSQGKKHRVFRTDRDDERDELAAHALGRSGKLRAPTARVGKTLLVGWGEEAWETVLG